MCGVVHVVALEQTDVIRDAPLVVSTTSLLACSRDDVTLDRIRVLVSQERPESLTGDLGRGRVPPPISIIPPPRTLPRH